MGSYQKYVREFQECSGQPVSDIPRQLTADELDFRENLVREEIKELWEAYIDGDRVLMLDALCDIKYVNDGTANQMGVRLDDIIGVPVSGGFELAFEILEGLPASDVKSINTLLHTCVFTLGFSLETFEEGLKRVHMSNMTKFCTTDDQIQRTIAYYKEKGIEVDPALRNKVTVIYRASDRKVLKNIDYLPVKLDDLV